MFSKKINNLITLSLYIFGLLNLTAAVICLIIWLTDLTLMNFLIFLGTLSSGIFWMLLAKFSRFLDLQLPTEEDEEDFD